MRLIKIDKTGRLPEDISVDDFLQEVIQTMVAHYQTAGFEPPWTGYVGMENGLPVGVCAFKGPPAEGRVEMAYGTAPGHEGRGVATALARELLTIAKSTDHHLTVFAQTLPEENASTSILKKLGFTMIGSREHPEDGTVWEWEQIPAVYGDDLAYIHDIGFSGLSEGWAPGLLKLLREAGIKTGTVVDLGCGGGGWIECLHGAGYKIIGVDISPAMIERARARVPSVQFHVGSIWSVQMPACRAITALGEVVCYRTDACHDPDLRSLFAKVFDVLQPGGVFVLDIAEIGLDRQRDRTFAEGDDWACLVRYEHEDARNRLHRYITAFRRVDSLFRRTQEHHILQLYDGAVVADLLNSVGFETQSVRSFGAAALLPLRLGLIARKP